MNSVSTIFIFAILSTGHCQFASIFDAAQQAPNCQIWSEWGNCAWVKGPQTRNKIGYFSQLSTECQQNNFFATTRTNYGEAIDNVYKYLRNVTLDKDACGVCSFRQSCGSSCDLSNHGGNYVNKIFVAEERCNEQQLDGNDQLTACSGDYDKIPKGLKECQVWPNMQIPLPNVPDVYKDLLYSVPLFNCVKATDQRNKPVCRCCCAPYTPSPRNQYLCLPPQN